MPLNERLRHNLAAAAIWLAFLVLYLGGVILLAIGLVFAWRQWWTVIHHHAGLWAIGAKTTEVFVVAVGFFLVLIIPFLRHRAGRTEAWRSERRSEAKKQIPVAEQP